jgi:acyl carrier protein
MDAKTHAMNDAKIEKVVALVAKALEISPEELGPDSSMQNVPLWDSVEHMTVCLLFEQQFGTTLDMDAITTATSIRALAALVP